MKFDVTRLGVFSGLNCGFTKAARGLLADSLAGELMSSINRLFAVGVLLNGLLSVFSPSHATAVADPTSATSVAAEPTAVDNPDAIAEIVVTAQKRSQSLIDVPIAVTAITGNTLKQAGFDGIQDLPNLIPGVRSTTPGGGGAFSTTIIRGVGQQDIAEHQEAPVATYVDGTYISFATAQTQPIFDLDRVEVLKGPQGTLFGRNATGGTIQFISRQPSQEFDGYASVSYGSFEKTLTEGAVGGALNSDWSARFSYHQESGGNYVSNPVGEDHNGETNYAGRLQALYKPVDKDFSLLFSFYGDVFPVQPGPAPDTTRVALNSEGLAYAPATFGAYQNFCKGLVGSAPTQAGHLGDCFSVITNPYKIPVPEETSTSGHYWNVAITLQAALTDSLSLTSITDYQQTHQLLTIPLSAGAPQIYNNNNPQGVQYSEELRLADHQNQNEWVIGLYALDIDNHVEFNTNLNALPQFGVTLDSPMHLITKSAALFAEDTYHLTPEFSIILGARGTYDHKHGVNTSGCTTSPAIQVDICGLIEASGPPVVQFTGFDEEISKTLWSYRAVAQYKPEEDFMAYMGVNRGVKAGGFNTGAAEFYSPTNAAYGPETLTNFEGGIKSRLFERRLSLDASAFYYHYQNLQSFSTNGGALYVFNVDKSYIKGAEFEAVYRPITGLELRTSATYLDTKAFNVPAGAGFGDYPIPGAPLASVQGSLRYAFNIGSGEFSMLFSGTHVDKRSTSSIDSPGENIPAYDKFDVRFGYDLGHFSYGFLISNLTNSLIFGSSVPFESLAGYTYNGVDPPRWFTVTGTYKF